MITLETAPKGSIKEIYFSTTTDDQKTCHLDLDFIITDEPMTFVIGTNLLVYKYFDCIRSKNLILKADVLTNELLKIPILYKVNTEGLIQTD